MTQAPPRHSERGTGGLEAEEEAAYVLAHRVLGALRIFMGVVPFGSGGGVCSFLMV